MVQQRSVALAIVLTIVTCGIYGIYWLIVLNDEINTVTGNADDTSGALVFLFTVITCGIYSYFWMYKTGVKLDDHEVSRGRSAQYRGILYLVLHFLGLGIISWALMQDTLNRNV